MTVPRLVRLERIVSGGQTGVDRAALNACLAVSFPCGGWCPAGRRAEDGVIPWHYPLREADSPKYPLRTRWNVRDSDGTLIMTGAALSGGSLLTVDIARQMRRPYLVVDMRDEAENRCVDAILQWLIRYEITVLNVAGPRESQQPGIYSQSQTLLLKLLAEVTRLQGQARRHGRHHR